MATFSSVVWVDDSPFSVFLWISRGHPRTTGFCASFCVVEDDRLFRWLCAENCTRGLFAHETIENEFENYHFYDTAAILSFPWKQINFNGLIFSCQFTSRQPILVRLSWFLQKSKIKMDCHVNIIHDIFFFFLQNLPSLHHYSIHVNSCTRIDGWRHYHSLHSAQMQLLHSHWFVSNSKNIIEMEWAYNFILESVNGECIRHLSSCFPFLLDQLHQLAQFRQTHSMQIAYYSVFGWMCVFGFVIVLIDLMLPTMHLIPCDLSHDESPNCNIVESNLDMYLRCIWCSNDAPCNVSSLLHAMEICLHTPNTFDHLPKSGLFHLHAATKIYDS